MRDLDSNPLRLTEFKMFLKSCLNRKYHEVAQEGEEAESRCLKENCYSRYSKCITNKALNKYLVEESSTADRQFSALSHLYSRE